jgi:purine-binding chemotaxis protein CheW
VGFVVGDVSYAVPIALVKEIVNPGGLTAVPHSPHSVVGVVDHRGQVVPIVDLRKRFGLPATTERGKAKWILLDVEERWVGLVVDRVTEVFGAENSKLGPAPLMGEGDELRGILGVVHRSGELVFVLDVSAFGMLTESVDPPALTGRVGGR